MNTIPTTFSTICSETRGFPRVEITVTKTKEIPASTGSVDMKIGGICPKCGQLHTSLVRIANGPHAPVYPTSQAQREMIAPDLNDPQRDGAL